MSAEGQSLDERIAARWEEAGLDASHENLDADREEDVEIDDDGGAAEEVETDDTPASADDDYISDSDTEGEEETPATEETVVEEAAKEEKQPEQTKAEEKAQKEAEDDLAEALGLGKPPSDPKKRAQWWKTRLPYSQVHKAVTARETKLRGDHETALKPLNEKITAYDARFADVRTVEDIITNKPEQYVKTLAHMFPETYGKMFAPLLGDGSETGKAATLPEMKDPGPKPEPDLELKDAQGNVTGKTYSVEGYQKLLEWQQVVTEQNMLKRFKPHMDFMEAQRAAAEKKQKDDQAAEAVRRGKEAAVAAVEEVKKWDFGAENVNEILKAAEKLDPRYDAETALNIAYRQVVLPKIKADRDKMREEILKESKKASAKATSVTVSQQKKVETPADGGNKTDLDARIKVAWRRAGYIK